MILDVAAFLERRRVSWDALEAYLSRAPGAVPMTLEEIREFHRLYQEASADLSRLSTYSADQEVRAYLETLVARAYAHLHEARRGNVGSRPLRWLAAGFPRVFRRHVMAFWLAFAAMIAGAVCGMVVQAAEPDFKRAVLPFEALHGDPSRRVATERVRGGRDLSGAKATFSSQLMTHNTRVAVKAFAWGITYGLGTLVVEFYNGVVLGVVAFDYVLAGEGRFLCAWLLPHGAVEIPAFLIAGQAGLVLAGAMIGRGRREPLMRRLRAAAPDIVTLLAGVALLLVWAGLVEAFVSQYHEPVVPDAVKIAFGLAEIAALALYLGRVGRGDGGVSS